MPKGLCTTVELATFVLFCNVGPNSPRSPLVSEYGKPSHTACRAHSPHFRSGSALVFGRLTTYGSVAHICDAKVAARLSAPACQDDGIMRDWGCLLYYTIASSLALGTRIVGKLFVDPEQLAAYASWLVFAVAAE